MQQSLYMVLKVKMCILICLMQFRVIPVLSIILHMVVKPKKLIEGD